MSESVHLRGGPFSGIVLDGFEARLLLMHQPPFFCTTSHGKWEHYEMATPNLYVYAGRCLEAQHYLGCGHDHHDEPDRETSTSGEI